MTKSSFKIKDLGVFQNDPKGFVRVFFNHYEMFEDFQEEVLNLITEFTKNDETLLRIQIQSGKGVGKTDLITWIAFWFLFSFKKISTSLLTGTKTQTVDTLFKNFHRVIEDCAIRHYIHAMQMSFRVFQGGRLSHTRTLQGVVTNEEKKDTIAGQHSEWNLVLADEASTITQDTFKTLEGVASSGKSIFLVTGNPTRINCILYDIWAGLTPSKWHQFTVSGYDMKRKSYNLQAMIDTYGEEGTVGNTVYIKGEFAHQEGGMFFNKDEASILFREELFSQHMQIYRTPSKAIYGVDIATGMGGDYTCVIRRQGYEAEVLLYSNTISNEELREYLTDLDTLDANNDIDNLFAIDGNGVGKGLEIELRRHGLTVFPVYNQGKPIDTYRYFNLKSNLYSYIKESIFEGGLLLTLNNKIDRNIAERQFLSIPFEFKKGCLSVASKVEMNKSPDLIDALAYSFCRGL